MTTLQELARREASVDEMEEKAAAEGIAAAVYITRGPEYTSGALLSESGDLGHIGNVLTHLLATVGGLIDAQAISARRAGAFESDSEAATWVRHIVLAAEAIIEDMNNRSVVKARAIRDHEQP